MKLEGIAAAVAAVTLSTLAAAALSATMAASLAKAPSVVQAAPEMQIELAHGCHPNIQRDRSGWHFHTRSCLRRNTAPPGLYDGASYRRFYRGPICTYRCKFVGPVKTCSQVCR